MEKSFEEELIDLAANTVTTYIGLSIIADLLVNLAKELDEDDWREICDQLQALVLYPNYALKPEV